jgi:hypothetical protein
MNREAIYSALFGVLAASSAYVTASRRLRHWSDVGPAEQPALFMVQKFESVQLQRGQVAKHVLTVDVFVYVQAPDELTPPAMMLNPLLDAIEAALAPAGPDLATNAQTLGGRVSNCAINGRIETDEGVLGGQSVAIIPIEIVVP